MSAIATALKHMLAAGMPHDAIVAAVAEMEAGMAVDEVAERRRAYDRERKRRIKSGGIPVESADSAECTEPTLSRPPNEINSNPPTHTPENKTPARKGHRLPADWQPSALTGDAAAAVSGWPPGAMERELSRFRDWAAATTGPNALKSNWDAAWRNWIRKTEDDGRYSKSAPQRQPSRGGSTRDAAQLALARMGHG